MSRNSVVLCSGFLAGLLLLSPSILPAQEHEHEHEDLPGDPVFTGPPLVSLTGPSADQVPLDPATIPKFAHELTRPPVLAGAPSSSLLPPLDPILEFTLLVKQASVQMLPPPFPPTTVLAYGGEVEVPGSSQTETVFTVPGPTIEAVRNVPHLLRIRNEIDTPHFLPVDPTLHWANPNNMAAPTSPFTPFPPGYADAQFPVPHVTHTHGLMVESEFDGTAEEWFTKFGHTGRNFVTRDYRQPNDQPATGLWYHDHTMGITRLNVYAGLAGNYFIREANDPLDAVLPPREYEVPLTIADRGFFTDGELNFTRVGNNPGNPYWVPGVPTTVNLVNGKVWPNLNVERRQYRFRILIGANNRLYNLRFANQGVAIPFTIIGSDGGYLPAPQTVSNVVLGVTERADILVDFSGLAPGTQIILENVGQPLETLGTVMRFTVLDTVPVPPPALPATLVHREQLVQDSRTRTKVMSADADAAGNNRNFLDGLLHHQATIDHPLVSATERWDLVQTAGVAHQIHLHLIEFQVLNRQPINAAAYKLRWLLMNGQPPLTTRPIVVDPTPFFTGPATAPAPYETGWKDTVQAPGNQVTRILARWAPQEMPVADARPGKNQFSIDPTTGWGYLWHCHVLGHEDNDMMRDMPLVKSWKDKTNYVAGDMIEYLGSNYRALVAHQATSAKKPPNKFDLWEKVNDNDGAWTTQVKYKTGDRVLHQGGLYVALQNHLSVLSNQPPNAQNWKLLPQTFCGQLQDFCHGNPDPTASSCHDTGHAGVEATCQSQFAACLRVCSPSHNH